MLSVISLSSLKTILALGKPFDVPNGLYIGIKVPTIVLVTMEKYSCLWSSNIGENSKERVVNP